MLKTDIRSAQEMFEKLGYKKDKDFFPDTPTYTDKYKSLLFAKILNVKLFKDSLVKIIGDVFECYDSIINLFGGQCQII